MSSQQVITGIAASAVSLSVFMLTLFAASIAGFQVTASRLIN
jgi:hypothetical protein